ncbi:MAG: restriction endonuclease subunit S [Deltaproteobacteria bacterium]|nr:restriction endonuclease subunit S [Deltaproteobacteria bacterium]
MKVQLKEIAQIQIGYQPRGKIRPHIDGEYEIIQSRDFDERRELDSSDLLSISIDREPMNYRVRAGDVLFMSRGENNFAAIVKGKKDKLIASGVFYIIRPNVYGTLTQYLAWFLNHPQTQKKLKGKAQAQTVALVPKKILESMEIDLPPLEIQKKITHMAELMNKEIELQTRLLEKRKLLIDTSCLSLARDDYSHDGKLDAAHIEWRISDNDFYLFIDELIKSGELEDELLEIVELIAQSGYDYLTENQKDDFNQYIWHQYYTEECGRCGAHIPWIEMFQAYEKGGFCGWCQHMMEKEK